MSSMGDALSSASLLLAALALVYGAWSGSIDKETNRIYAAGENTKEDEKKETRRVRNRRALPISVGSWLIAVTFVPRDFDIFRNTLSCAEQDHCGYDDVAAIFILTQVFILALALHLTGRVRALSNKLAQ
jgi:hypothetical protein